ncbi:hypothetical protein OG613_41680 [Streptomyces sp. NBC_00015]|uniref:hypothetical protein n=1 Tax=Streptomyces sp. NBC_00015 TaxID=2903611 RepID=UPI003247DE17
MPGHAGDHDAGPAGRDLAGERVEDVRRAEQIDVQQPLDGRLGGGDTGGLDHLGDRTISAAVPAGAATWAGSERPVVRTASS